MINVNYWINLRGHSDKHPVKKVLETCWERGKALRTGFGWIGSNTAKEYNVYNLKFCSAVLWPLRPMWTLGNINVDMTLSNIKKMNTMTNLLQEYYNHIESK